MTCITREEKKNIIAQAFDEAVDAVLDGNPDRAETILDRAFGKDAKAQARHAFESILAYCKPALN